MDRIVPAYPRGFIASLSSPIVVPAHFNRVSDLPFYLYTCNSLPVTTQQKGAISICVIGEVYNTINPEKGPVLIVKDLLSSLPCDLSRNDIFSAQTSFKNESKLSAFFSCEEALCGRYIIFVHSSSYCFLVQDATGLKPVFKLSGSSSVFFASSPQLASIQGSDSSCVVESLPGAYGFWGSHTPFKDVYLLNPLYAHCMAKGKPVQCLYSDPRLSRSIDESASTICAAAKGALRAISYRNKNLLISLTAGHDSRLTLAIADSLGVLPDLTTFTYLQANSSTATDVKIATQISSDLNCKHVILDHRQMLPNTSLADRQSLNREVKRNTYSRHGHSLVSSYCHRFGDQSFVHLRSNLVELFRASAVDKRASLLGLDLSSGIVDFSVKIYGSSVKDLKKNLSLVDRVKRGFEDLYFPNAESRHISLVDLRDRFFLEHRMAAWGAMLTLESDFAFETLIIFNSRSCIDAALCVDKDIRAANALYAKLFDLIGSDFARRWPINP